MGGKTGHINKGTFKQIFRDNWEEFKRAYGKYNRPYYDRVIRKMLDCGDLRKSGYATYLCPNCGEKQKVAFSCKSSFCLSCAKVHTDEWVSFVGRRLFPAVSYRHVVLTVPEDLRIWFFRHPKLLSALMKTGHQCLMDTISHVKRERLELGSIVVLQTAGRSGEYNPHLHILVTSGGINAEGKWINYKYLPYEVLHKKWQYYLLTMLRQEVNNAKMHKAIDECWKNYKKGLVAWIENGKMPQGATGLARYLAKYVVSPPISVRRIEDYDGKSVRYWYNDHETGKRKVETLEVLTFIGRMVQHILPKGFQRIRYYGLHASSKYGKVRAQLEEMLPHESEIEPETYHVIPRKKFRQRFLFAFDKDPFQCQRCGGHMELLEVWVPGHGFIVDRWDSIFTEEADGRGPPRDDRMGKGHAGARPDPEVQLSLPFMPVPV